MRLDMPNTNDEILHPYYQLANGEFVSKKKVDDAIQLLIHVVQGLNPVYLTDEELFTKGNKIEAVSRYREKHNTSLAEAKQAIEHLRGEIFI